MKKIIKVIGNCLLGLVIFLLVVLLVINFSGKSEGISKVGKYSFFSVVGDSMYPEIKDGDFIVVNSEKEEKYQVGDIVSYLYEVDGEIIVVTHKVSELIDIQGTYKYVTKGVNNNYEDEKIINHSEIIGEYINFRIPFLGYFVEFGRTSVGYFLLVVAPLGIVALVSIYELLKEIEKRKKGEA